MPLEPLEPMTAMESGEGRRRLKAESTVVSTAMADSPKVRLWLMFMPELAYGLDIETETERWRALEMPTSGNALAEEAASDPIWFIEATCWET
jgi:hypothetical protein